MSSTKWFIAEEISPDNYVPYADGKTTVWLMVKKVNEADKLVGIHHPDGIKASEKWYKKHKAMLNEMYPD